MKNFLLQNVVPAQILFERGSLRYNLSGEPTRFAGASASRYFSGSLAVWKECGEAAAAACLPRPARRGEAENSFELYSEYTASWNL